MACAWISRACSLENPQVMRRDLQTNFGATCSFRCSVWVGVFGFSPFSVLLVRFGMSNSSITIALVQTEAICLHAELLPWLRQSALLPGECPLQRGGGSNGRTLWEPHIARRLATGSIPVVWPSNFARRDLAQLTSPVDMEHHGTTCTNPPPDVQFSLVVKISKEGKGVATRIQS